MPERKGYVSARLAAPLRAPAGDGASGAPVHDFDVVVHATMANPGQRRGAGLIIVHGFHESPFGAALVMMTEGAVCGLAFGDGDGDGGRQAALADMMARWPLAHHRGAPDLTGSVAARIFGSRGSRREEVPVVLIGTPFDLAVWQELLRIPMGCVATYTDIARHLGRPRGARAVGTANGRNPISYVVPCHRAVRSDGALGGYYWGLARKRAMIEWEARRASEGAP